MFKKIISAITATALLCSIYVPLSVNAVSAEISVKNIIDEQQTHRDTTIESPDLIPVNENIQGLDENIIKIMIDPGHFDHYNRSPVYSPYWESIMTWKLSNYLQKELQALGVHADLTKDSLEADPTLNERGFSSKGYDFFISMHSNAGAYESMDQPLAFVYQQLPWTDIDDISAELGGLIAEKTSEVMQTNQKGGIARRKGTGDWDRNGVMDDEWYSVLFSARYVGTPGILMEHSFHTNYRATLWLYDDDNLKRLAKEEAEVIYDYFSSIKPQQTIVGDVNNDGLIDSVDATQVLIYYAKLSTNPDMSPDKRLKTVYDVNSDGFIDSVDASAILSFYSYNSTGGNETDIKNWLENN
ncbi:MAG: N-acetylmuramoyl-L-alanine amidase [Ruminococcus sp.]|nr:N-acetylmuramoyl-L-alanine amidase [Ruminococcus sp.]